MFFKAFPEQAKEALCLKCYETTGQVGGVFIDDRGIMHAWLCNQCQNVNLADKRENPFNEVNQKLDRLLRWAGHSDD